MEIRRYVLVDKDDQEQGSEYDTLLIAQEYAERYGYAIIARTYEYTDSELVWTPDGSDTWPPEKQEAEA